MQFFGRVLLLCIATTAMPFSLAAPKDQAKIDPDTSISQSRSNRPSHQEKHNHNKHRDDVDWKAGTTLPEEYRVKDYQIDSSNNPKLTPPTRYQQWIKVKNKYILLNVITNTIIKVVPIE